MKLSPHVTIYRFPPSAITSVMNRATGVYLSALYVGTGMFLWTPYRFDKIPYQDIVEGSVVGSFVYHTLGGLRHFVWDVKPSLMTKSFAKWSSVGLLVSSLGLTSSYMYIKKKKPTIK